jgi:aspartyl-tRNA(Asn)/glutamyl-tRNA(Gln) amidotransferase subunit C
MKLTNEEVLQIARLARLGMTETETKGLGTQLSDILENFEILQQVDTSDVSPTAQSIDLRNVVSDDIVVHSFPPGEILANALRKEGDYFRVRSVLE